MSHLKPQRWRRRWSPSTRSCRRWYCRMSICLTDPDSWPGNVRELRNVIERVMILEDSDLITADWLPRGLVRDERTVSSPHVVAASQTAEIATPSFQLTDEGIDLEEIELSLVRQAMERSLGNQTRASELLGIS